MTIRPYRLALGLSIALAALLYAPAAHAGTLWYNGSYDSRGSLTNENGVPATNTSNPAPPVQTSLVYDNFTVPTGQTWTITSVFSNNFVDYPYAAPTTATWSIRSGVSSGVGGTVVASGDSSATLTALPYTLAGGFVAETVTANLSTAVVLTAGTYWLAVAPDSAGYYGDNSFVMTTSGANSIGAPGGADGNSYITNTYPPAGSAGSYSFTPTTTALNTHGTSPYGSKIDFSMGVNGTFSVPEPSSLVLSGLGLIGSLAWAKKRRPASAR